MLWTNVKRIFRTGSVAFWRNKFVSLASVLVMVITLFVIGSIVFTTALLSSTLSEIKDKVDVNVYFVAMASEEDVLAVKTRIESLPEVKSVEYLSREQVIAQFRERHANDPLILQSLEELGDNPFGALLNIKAHETSQYETIATFLESENGLSEDQVSIIDKVDSSKIEKKVAIERLARIINSGKKLGLVLTIVLAAITILNTFNTIELVIHMSKEEISVMRLVGASTAYIRGPFVIMGIIYGLVAGIVTLILFYPVTYWLGTATRDFFTGINVFDYYVTNFTQFFVIIIASGMLIGAVSSYLAIKKYLTV